MTKGARGLRPVNVPPVLCDDFQKIHLEGNTSNGCYGFGTIYTALLAFMTDAHFDFSVSAFI